jgi:hypothetical protein
MLKQPKIVVKPGSFAALKFARYIRTKKPIQKLVLLTLALYANAAGECFPSYERLMLDTGIKSKTTIAASLQYLRDTLKVIDWTVGHGNQFAHVPNRYHFKSEEMVAILKKQKADEEDLTSPFCEAAESIL